MVKQLRVTTRTNSKLLKIEDIKKAVFKHPEGITPKYISIITGINDRTVRSYVHKIEDIKQKGYGGLWIPVGEKGDSPLKITETKIHDEIITYQIPIYNGEHIEENFDCGALGYKFTIGKTSKQATFRRIAVDGVQIPVEIPTIMVVCRDFKNKIKNYTGFEPTDKEIIFQLIELNQTFENMKLNFGKCFTLETLNCLYRIYQKKKEVRVETKLKDITAETLFEFFRGNYKIIELEEIVKRIAESQKNIENYLVYISKIISPFNNSINSISEKKKGIEIEETKKEVVKTSYIKESSKIIKTQSKINDIFEKSPKENEESIMDIKKPEVKIDRPDKADKYAEVYF